jgi:hypothetical protein
MYNNLDGFDILFFSGGLWTLQTLSHTQNKVSQMFNNKMTSTVISAIILFQLLLSTLIPQGNALALDAPTPLAPGDMVTVTAIDEGSGIIAHPQAIPAFSWTPVEGATTYRFQMSNQIGFNTTPINITTPNTEYIPITISALNDGEWYWRVRAEKSGEQSPWMSCSGGDPCRFTKDWASDNNKPQLLSPDPFAVLDFYNSPTFNWERVMGAARYRFQIATDPTFITTSITVNILTLRNQYQPLTKLENGLYFWRVIPVDPGDRLGTPSDTWEFTQSYNQVPVLIEPENNAQPVFTPTFRWEAMRGAQQYRLQYSTDVNFSSNVTTIDTRNTTYTPINPLPNDVNYYWRVRVTSGASISPWSEVRTFLKQWYIRPQLLTPTNNYQNARFPLFSWTPVPGAAYYRIEYGTTPLMEEILVTEDVSNTFYTPRSFSTSVMPDRTTYYWRVTPYDKQGQMGKASEQVFSFATYGDAEAPHLIYPSYYYPPNNYGPGYEGIFTDPYEDRTVPLPIFMWHRVLTLADGSVANPLFRLQVATDNLFNNIVWEKYTENLAAAPTNATGDTFSPAPDTDYYWRVCQTNNIGGDCYKWPDDPSLNLWSQVWRTRINTVNHPQKLPETSPMTLLRPVQAAEVVETTPMLEWFPYPGASGYDIQISTDSSFDAQYIVDQASTNYPVYTPTTSLAQRSLSRYGFTAYYWRVRPTGGAWSTPRYFTIAAQSQWRLSRTAGSTDNLLLIGTDPAGDAGSINYDLRELYTAQSNSHWHISFWADTSGSDMTYAMYLDQDHIANSGAPSDARGNAQISVAPPHFPEYAIYLDQISNTFSAANVFIYEWDLVNLVWKSPQPLNEIGGSLTYNDNILELQLPNTAIGMNDETGSYAISVFSLQSGGGLPQDTVPSDPNAHISGNISRFSNVSERMNLRYPFNDDAIDPTTFSSLSPFFWDNLVRAPYAGGNSRAYLDPLFTNSIANVDITSNTPYFGPSSYTWLNDFSQGDNTYYWRIKPRYRVSSTAYFGTWSQGARFERQGFVPQNLTESVTFATPTFKWERAEGALTYRLLVDNDPNFGSPEINVTTSENQYTPTGTLANGLYYWKVLITRRGNAVSEWSETKTFNLALPRPALLFPANDPNGTNPVRSAPTFCWQPVLSESDGVPVLAAYRYRIQVSRDINFSNTYEQVDTEQSCYSPTKGYDDGRYYWRVAMFEGANRLGQFSDPYTYVKQYPVTNLISPIDEPAGESPKFIWTPVNGASTYRLQVSVNPTFTPLYENITTHNVQYVPVKKYTPEAVYYWRVAIIDRDGKIGPFTDAALLEGANKVYLPAIKK